MHPVVAVTEQCEMSGGQPPQQLRTFGRLADRRLRGRIQACGQRSHGASHRIGIVSDLAKFGEQGRQCPLDPLQHRITVAGAQLDVDPGFGDDIATGFTTIGRIRLRRIESLTGRDGTQPPAPVAQYIEDRMHNLGDGGTQPLQRRGQRIDQQRHIVVDDLQRRPQITTVPGPIEPGQRGSGAAPRSQLQMVAEDLLGSAGDRRRRGSRLDPAEVHRLQIRRIITESLP